MNVVERNDEYLIERKRNINLVFFVVRRIFYYDDDLKVYLTKPVASFINWEVARRFMINITKEKSNDRNSLGNADS